LIFHSSYYWLSERGRADRSISRIIIIIINVIVFVEWDDFHSFSVLGLVTSQQSDLDIKYCNNSCTQYFDGCNDCTCNNNGTSTCGNNKCQTLTQDHCNVCKSNTQWNSCGSYCTKTCNNLFGFACIEECVEKCECPQEYPIWDDITNKCIAESSCNDSAVTTSINFNEKYCENGCTSYFNGCNVCHCDGNITSTCGNNICDVLQDDYCLACVSNKEWTECGSACIATCDNPTPLCIQECESTCYCPNNTVWNGSQCVPLNECTTQTLEVCICEPSSNIGSSSVGFSRLKKFCNSVKQKTSCNNSRCTWKCQ